MMAVVHLRRILSSFVRPFAPKERVVRHAPELDDRAFCPATPHIGQMNLRQDSVPARKRHPCVHAPGSIENGTIRNGFGVHCGTSGRSAGILPKTLLAQVPWTGKTVTEALFPNFATLTKER